MKVVVMRKRLSAIAAGAAAVGLMIATAGPASATPDNTVTATATLTTGTLTLSAPTTIAFPATLGGTDQTIHAPLVLNVHDDTGLALGWNISLTSTTFTTGGSGAHTLADGSVTDDGAFDEGVCDASTVCTPATNEFSPVTVPSAAIAPNAVVIQTAGAGTGMAGQTWTHDVVLAVPANASAGIYTSTWTYTIAPALPVG